MEATGVTPERFHSEIVPAGRPVVLRGLVAHWPVVAAAQQSGAALAQYLARFDRARAMGAMLGPPRIKGRLFYNDDATGFNFRRQSVKLDGAFDFLLRAAEEAEPPTFAIQSAQVWNGLPGFEGENLLPLLGPEVEPRVWIGNRVIVAAHHDPNENIACVVSGRRRFTLFPPEQIDNLYMGPMEKTPAGATISMVDFDDPDPVAHPRFAEAMKAAIIVDMVPGDALYIPYMWWHHVRSVDAINMLVNYWWGPTKVDASHPTDALLHAMLAIRHLPEAHRRAWRAHFDHYVFAGEEQAGAHLPTGARGILGPLDDKGRSDVRAAVQRGLDRE
ncbi:cupin-like domain-containing protein [Sphingomonas sp. LT1P40]|uniref:cupin-like domain-containing protein n=1 Tax=Alteristakelama amylovorans TaxID=3096166 RepID=UPI002FC77634